MKYENDFVQPLYMVVAYANNILDLIDDIEKGKNKYFTHDIKRIFRTFSNSVENNKKLQFLLNELHKVDSMEINQYRDEVDKTVVSLLENSPQDFVRLEYVRKIVEDDSLYLFTEAEMLAFAIKHKVSSNKNVGVDLEEYVDEISKSSRMIDYQESMKHK